MPNPEQTAEPGVTKAETHISGLGWIRITWDTPVTRDHADEALLAAMAPARQPDPRVAGLVEALREIESYNKRRRTAVPKGGRLVDTTHLYLQEIARKALAAFQEGGNVDD